VWRGAGVVEDRLPTGGAVGAPVMSRLGCTVAAAAALIASCSSSVSRADSAAPPAAKERAAGGIQWFTRLKDGLAEAKRTGKPILFLSAAPSCGGVPGVW